MSIELKAKPRLKPSPASKKSDGFDLIILGGGPAGMTAALYAARARLNTLLVEKMVMGGAVSTTHFIENYPGFPEGISGMELSDRMQAQIKRFDIRVCWGNAQKIKRKKSGFEMQIDDKPYFARALIIASGTEAARLNVPGEEEFRGRGVSYCATCDGAFYKDKNIMVVGGGNSAVEEALYLTRFGKKVSIVHRRDALRADKILAERASADPKIYFYWHSTVDRISGGQKVEEVVLNDLQTGKKLKVSADGIFVYIGSKPNSEIVKELVRLDKNGFILADQNMQTSAGGIFAAGDILAKPLRQVSTAVGDGAIAAESARKYIEGGDQ